MFRDEPRAVREHFGSFHWNLFHVYFVGFMVTVVEQKLIHRHGYFRGADLVARMV